LDDTIGFRLRAKKRCPKALRHNAFSDHYENANSAHNLHK
jgi:hypothetical protein